MAKRLRVDCKTERTQTRVKDAPASVLSNSSLRGQPLEAETRTFMEPRFGHDFSQLNVLADPRANAPISTSATLTLQRQPGLEDLYEPMSAGAMTSAARQLAIRLARQRLIEGVESGIYSPQDIEAESEFGRDQLVDLAEENITPEGMEGSHLYSAAENPELAGNPDYIMNTEASNHLYGHHGGNYANDPNGSPLDSEWDSNGFEGERGVRVEDDFPYEDANQNDAAERWLKDNDPNYGESSAEGAEVSEEAEAIEGLESTEGVEGLEGVEALAESAEGVEAVEGLAVAAEGTEVAGVLAALGPVAAVLGAGAAGVGIGHFLSKNTEVGENTVGAIGGIDKFFGGDPEHGKSAVVAMDEYREQEWNRGGMGYLTGTGALLGEAGIATAGAVGGLAEGAWHGVKSIGSSIGGLFEDDVPLFDPSKYKSK